MGYSWALLGCSGSALGVFWVSLEMLFGSCSSSGEGLETKTSKCVKMTTFAVFSRPQGFQNEVNIEPETINKKRAVERERAEKRATWEGKVAYP